MSANAPAADTSVSAAVAAPPDLSLLPEEGGGDGEAATTTTKKPTKKSSKGSLKSALSKRSVVGKNIQAKAEEVASSGEGGGGGEKEEGEGGCDEWWQVFVCCGTAPNGEFKTAGYDGNDTDDSDEEHEATRAEFHRCDVCGCRALSRGCLVSLCCQEPRRSKSFVDFGAHESVVTESGGGDDGGVKPAAYVDPEQ